MVDTKEDAKVNMAVFTSFLQNNEYVRERLEEGDKQIINLVSMISEVRNEFSEQLNQIKQAIGLKQQQRQPSMRQTQVPPQQQQQGNPLMESIMQASRAGTQQAMGEQGKQ